MCENDINDLTPQNEKAAFIVNTTEVQVLAFGDNNLKQSVEIDPSANSKWKCIFPR